MVEVIPLKEATQQALDELNALSHELHDDDRSATMQDLGQLVKDETAILFVVRDGEKIIGMASLYLIPKIGSKTSLLEDVIVDSKYRGQGLGEKLVRAVVDEAKKRGLKSISLSSRPVRVAAHKLYEKVGFQKKETDVFKLTL